MQAWKAIPQSNPRFVVVILRGLLSHKEDRARYKDLWESAREEFSSETTFQVYLNWLVKNRIITREKRSRKEVWYSIQNASHGAEISTIMDILSNTVKATSQKPRPSEVHFTDLVESFVEESVFPIAVAIGETVGGPVDLISRKLGSGGVVELLAESIALSFKTTVTRGWHCSNPTQLYREAVEQGSDIVDRIRQSISGRTARPNTTSTPKNM